MRRELRITTARALTVAAAASSLPLPSYAMETSSYSSKALDRGVVVGVYNPYAKELKLFHYWVVRGKGYTDKSSNTACEAVGKILDVAVSTRKVKCGSWRKASYSVPAVRDALSSSSTKVSPLVNDLYYCPSSGQFGYKTSDGYYQASISIDDYAVCRRIVDPRWVNRKFKPSVPFDYGQNGISGGLANVYFRHVPFGGGSKGALDLLAAYMQATGAPAGILAVEGLNFHKHKHKCGFFKKCVDYIWDEKVVYYEISRAPSPTPLQGGLYLSSQGIGSNLYVHSDRIEKITKKGWSFIAVVVSQVALTALTGGLGFTTLANFLGGMFATSTLVSGVSHGWGSGAYRLGEGITPGAFNDFGKDFKDESSDPGSRKLKDLFRSATDLSPGVLDGFIEARNVYSSIRTNWEPAAPLSVSVVKSLPGVKADEILSRLKETITGGKMKEIVENYFNKPAEGFMRNMKKSMKREMPWRW